MRFQKIKATAAPETYFTGYVGRKAYKARDLIQPSVVKPMTSSFAPSSNPSVACTPEWVTKDEMMRRLGMGETYFDSLVKRRKIPRRRYSRKMVRFNPVAVEAALAVYDVGVVS